MFQIIILKCLWLMRFRFQWKVHPKTCSNVDGDLLNVMAHRYWDNTYLNISLPDWLNWFQCLCCIEGLQLLGQLGYIKASWTQQNGSVQRRSGVVLINAHHKRTCTRQLYGIRHGYLPMALAAETDTYSLHAQPTNSRFHVCGFI